MSQLAGKTIIVTGAGNGIGRTSALTLAGAGASVVVADIDGAAGAETASTIQAAGGQASFVKVDVTDSGDVKAMVNHAIEIFGHLDGAHNNAGVLGSSIPLIDVDDDDWRKVIDINLTSVFLCMKHEIRAILQQNRPGSIVNTASFSGLVAVPNAAAYVASKHGVVGLTKAAAVEYGRKGIRVNAVCPGTVNTQMMQEWIAANPKVEKALTGVSPMRRLAEASEVADAVVWLCSDAASFVNGHALPVDGGATVQ
jgi:NAD(P)-dependent dehydrogenase (short-subunit alcohol dehydrogenase family)